MMEAFLLGLIAFIAQCDYALGTSLISRPIVTGFLTGIVMGDIKMGLIMGATLELAFIGSFAIGGAIPPDVVSGGILGVAFAISSGAGVETALLLALPIATFTLILKNAYLGVFIPILSHKADSYADEGNTRGIELMHLISGFGLSLMLGLVVFFSYLLGSETISLLLKSIPEFIHKGLAITTGLIPTLGFAMLAKLLITKKVLPYFFIGFAIAIYTEIPLTGIAIFGALIAIVTVNPATQLKTVENNNIGQKEENEDEF